jgi:hypothetical protein
MSAPPTPEEEAPVSRRKKYSQWVRYLFIGFSIVLTLGILGWLVYREREVLLHYDWHLQYAFIAYSLVLYSIVILLTSLVWGWILAALGYPINYWKNFRAFNISALGKRLPGTVWFVAWRMNLYKSEGFPTRIIPIASGVELAVSTISAVIVAAIFAIPVIQQYSFSLWGILILLALNTVMLHPRLIRWVLQKLKVDAKGLEYKKILLWIAAYVFIRILVGGLYFLIASIITPISIEHLPLVIGACGLVAALATFLFFSPSNLGFAEISYSLVLSTFLPSSIAVIVVLAYRLLVIVYEIIWACFCLAQEMWSGRAGKV